MADVKVKLKDASGNVLHPETEWSLVQGRPSIGKAIFGEEWKISNTISINGGQVYINNKRPFTVRHIMGIGGCEFEIFDDQDKELTMSDVKSIMGTRSLPAFGYDSTNKRIFYSVRYNLNGFYADYVKVTNGVLDRDTANLGDDVTEIARYVLKQ